MQSLMFCVWFLLSNGTELKVANSKERCISSLSCWLPSRNTEYQRCLPSAILAALHALSDSGGCSKHNQGSPAITIVLSFWYCGSTQEMAQRAGLDLCLGRRQHRMWREMGVGWEKPGIALGKAKSKRWGRRWRGDGEGTWRGTGQMLWEKWADRGSFWAIWYQHAQVLICKTTSLKEVTSSHSMNEI